MPASRRDIVAAARELLGTPWMHQGRQAGYGVDCVGVVVHCAHSTGLSDYDIRGYARTSRLARQFTRHFDANMDRVPLLPGVAGEEGDVILFRDRAFPCHCGVLTFVEVRGRGPLSHVVHSRADHGRVVEQPYEGELERQSTHRYVFRGIS